MPIFAFTPPNYFTTILYARVYYIMVTDDVIVREEFMSKAQRLNEMSYKHTTNWNLSL